MLGETVLGETVLGETVTPDLHDGDMTIFEIEFTTGDRLHLEGADAYQPEGSMTTFFASGSSRSTIDSWSTRIASYRTADIASVRRASSREVIDVTASELVGSLAA